MKKFYSFKTTTKIVNKTSSTYISRSTRSERPGPGRRLEPPAARRSIRAGRGTSRSCWSSCCTTDRPRPSNQNCRTSAPDYSSGRSSRAIRAATTDDGFARDALHGRAVEQKGNYHSVILYSMKRTGSEFVGSRNRGSLSLPPQRSCYRRSHALSPSDFGDRATVITSLGFFFHYFLLPRLSLLL